MNLIPYNPVSEFDHKTPSGKEMIDFRNSLEDEVSMRLSVPQGEGM